MGKSQKGKGKGEVLATLVQFDARHGGDNVRVKYSGVPFADVTPLTDYHPSGGTPLLDAVGTTIAHLDAEHERKPDAIHIAFVLDESGSMTPLRKTVIDGYNEFVGSLKGIKPDDRGGRAMLIVFTDGEENMSREHTQATIKQMIDERETAGWLTTVYMGANQDAWRGAGAAGMPAKAGTYMNYTSSRVGTASALRSTARRAEAFVADSVNYATTASAMGDTVGEFDEYDNVEPVKPTVTSNYSEGMEKATTAIKGSS